MGWACAAGQGILHERRSSASDLEVGGELKGLPAGVTRYVRYAELLRLPQEHFVAEGDDNLKKDMRVQGVALETLARLFASDPEGTMMVAICSDEYRGNYPREYVADHRPVLVLKIVGKGPERWPKSEYGGPLGPYLISHPLFKPAFKVLSHDDEAQVPFAVTRIEFRREALVYGAIQPPGVWGADSVVGQGYAIARQDCFRCHNMGVEGGTVAGESWIELGTMAAEDGAKFRQMIRNPASVKRDAKMPAHADYDDATLDALTAYFRMFAGGGSRRAR
jgi:mono/diheme cytochrome c family protein